MIDRWDNNDNDDNDDNDNNNGDDDDQEKRWKMEKSWEMSSGMRYICKQDSWGLGFLEMIRNSLEIGRGSW